MQARLAMMVHKTMRGSQEGRGQPFFYWQKIARKKAKEKNVV
jgi:hypothetical protein